MKIDGTERIFIVDTGLPRTIKLLDKELKNQKK